MTTQDILWQFEPPKDRDKVVWLLTIMGVAIRGQWCGRVGEFYVGWSECK